MTVLNQTPSAFYQLMQAEGEKPKLGQNLALRYVVFGGEALEPTVTSSTGTNPTRRPPAREHVRHHRDDGARELGSGSTRKTPRVPASPIGAPSGRISGCMYWMGLQPVPWGVG